MRTAEEKQIQQASRWVVAAVLAVASTAAVGQQIDLACSGDMFQYEPYKVHGTASGAATVDIENSRIMTPVGGEFRIIVARDTSISFDGEQDNLRVFGTLDRITGRMTVFWRTPEEEAKLLERKPWKMSRYADLTCSLSKRLF